MVHVGGGYAGKVHVRPASPVIPCPTPHKHMNAIERPHEQPIYMHSHIFFMAGPSGPYACTHTSFLWQGHPVFKAPTLTYNIFFGTPVKLYKHFMQVSDVIVLLLFFVM